MEQNNLVLVIDELIAQIVDDIKAIDADKEKALYPDGQKLGLVKALKNLQLCLDTFDTEGKVTSLDFDPDIYLSGRL